MTYDAIVVGAGHNGLVAAAYLAKAGRRVLVLERRDVLGGAAVSEAVWPGWTVSTASYVCSLLHPQIVDDLRLRSYGYEAYPKDPSSFTPVPDGRSLLLGPDGAANAREIASFDARDVAGFEAFEGAATALGARLFDAFERDDPEHVRFDDATHATLYGSAAAFVERYVATDALQATLATDGLIGTYAGPRDAGTAYVLAYHYAGRALGTQGAWGFVRGGMGAISRAIALSARIAGAQFVTNATVARIVVRDGRAAGVVLADGTEYDAPVVLSGADPIATFGEMLDSRDVPSDLAARLREWRIEGCSLKLNLALGELPDFTARPGKSAPLAHHRATIHVAPSIDYLQAAHDDARTHGASRAPMLECFMQTPTDPSLAPPGKHLLSIFAQYYPYHRSDGPWTQAMRDDAQTSIVDTLARYAPNLPDAIEGSQLLAAPDLESRFGLHGGHIFHGELLPGQILGERFATRTPVAGLYLCGSGASPGGCVSGIPGLRAARAVAVDTFAPLAT
ncbi:MAG: NAD(P)/FAD-dependent oxidoreductase [Vulcanimicrobiaceae bacterium]